MAELPETRNEILEFLGEINTKYPDRIPLGALRESSNIDITDSFKVRSRNGYELLKTLANCTWAYATLDQSYLYLIDSGTLYKVIEDLTLIELESGMPTTDLYEVEIGNDVYLSSGHVISGNVVRTFKLENPTPPKVSIVKGDLPIGQYQVVTTTIKDGLESGHSSPIIVNLTMSGGLLISAGSFENIYVTKTNGSVYFLAGNTYVGVYELDVLTDKLDNTLINALEAPDNITNIAFYESMLFCGVQDYENNLSFVFYSKPFHYHLFDIEVDNFIVAGELRLLVAANDGLIIGTDQEILSYTTDNGLHVLANYGVPKGHSGVQLMDGNVEFWTHRGMCKALPFENKTQEQVSVKAGNYCTVAHVEQNGYERFIALTDTGGASNNQL